MFTMLPKNCSDGNREQQGKRLRTTVRIVMAEVVALVVIFHKSK